MGAQKGRTGTFSLDWFMTDLHNIFLPTFDSPQALMYVPPLSSDPSTETAEP